MLIQQDDNKYYDFDDLFFEKNSGKENYIYCINSFI